MCIVKRLTCSQSTSEGTIEAVTGFKYLEAITEANGSVHREVENRISTPSRVLGALKRLVLVD